MLVFTLVPEVLSGVVVLEVTRRAFTELLLSAFQSEMKEVAS